MIYIVYYTIQVYEKSIGNHFLDYLGPSNFKKMSLYLKQSIFNTKCKKKNLILS